MHPLAAGFRFQGGLEGALLLHGWTGSPAQMRPLAEVLHEAGFAVACPRLAGHGTRVTDLVGVGWRDWLRDAATAAQDLLDEGKRIHLIGFSMGGVLSLLLAPGFGAASVTTINAPMTVWDRRARLAWTARHSRRIRPGDPPASLPEEMREYRQEYRDTPEGSVAELMDLVRAARRALPRVTCPALIVQSRIDETVRPESGETLRDGVGSGQRRLLWLDHSAHVALLDRERDVLGGEIVRHLRRAIRLMSTGIPDPYHPTTEH
jgi:carboxylesterase